MIATKYKVVTPHGTFEAQWDDDEDSPVKYAGNQDAIAFFRAWLALNSVTGQDGYLLNPDRLEPIDLYGFCQSVEYGITVLPNAEDLIEAAQETEDDEMQATLDAVDDAQTFILIGEGAQLLQRLNEDADTFFADLGRLREIVQAIGGDAKAEEAAPDALIADLVAAGFNAKYRGKTMMLYKENGFIQQYTNNKQANAKVEQLRLAGFAAHVTAAHPFTIVIDGKASVAESAGNETEAKRDPAADLKALSPFLSGSQRKAIQSALKGEEGQFFAEKVKEYADRIANMPKTYGQDGMGDKAIAYLHYFIGGMDWYITEKDMEGEGTEQAFGLADFGDGGELGYISIAEVVLNGAELDLYWEPKTLAAVKGVEEKPEVSDDGVTLTVENAFVGAKIQSKTNPEWGVKTLKKDRNGWIQAGDSGEAMLSEGEFKFWNLVGGERPAQNDTERSQQFHAYEKFINENGFAGTDADSGLLREINFDDRLKEGEAEILIEMAQKKAREMTNSDDDLAMARSVIQGSEFKSLKKDIMSSLGSIKGIDEGSMPGFDRSLFVSSITGKIKTRANRNPLLAGVLLAWLFVTQKQLDKPAVTDRNSIWKQTEWQKFLPLFDATMPVVNQEVTTELAKPSEQAQGGKYRYAIVNRPVSIGTIPKGIEYTVEPRPAKGEPHYDMARHGILVTNRPLTDAETKSFELAPIIEGAALDDLASKVAKSLAEYAEGYVEQMAENYAIFSDAVHRGASKVSDGYKPSYVAADLESKVGELLKQMAQTEKETNVSEPTQLGAQAQETAGAESQAEDEAFLASVIDGTADMWNPELADKLAALYEKHSADGLAEKVNEAINAYSTFALNV